nr:hypothetical protein [Tanacetum cinerariifolium]
MEAGSKDRQPMLAPGNYVQWKSRIKRYFDTKPNHDLIHYCLENPPYQLDWTNIEVLVSEGSPITTTERIRETYKNVSQDIRDQLNAEAEAGESINVQDLETNLYWEFGKFTSQDGETLESYYSRFYKMMNELIRNQCKVTNHQVNVQFLLQLQPEWQRPSMVDEDDETSKDKEIDKLMALISLSFKKIYKPTNNLQTSSNTSRANQDNSPRINRNAEANNRLSETNNLLYAEYKKSEAELAIRNSKEYASQMKLQCAKVKEMRNKLSAHQETISILSKQKEAQIKLYKTRDDKELDKVIELENKVKNCYKNVKVLKQSFQRAE